MQNVQWLTAKEVLKVNAEKGLTMLVPRTFTGSLPSKNGMWKDHQ